MDRPTQDEINRVAAYWENVRSLACTHETILLTSHEPPTCESCGRPVRMMSDIQIEDLRGRN